MSESRRRHDDDENFFLSFVRPEKISKIRFLDFV